MCNHGFLEEDDEPQEPLTMHRIRKFLKERNRRMDDFIQRRKDELSKEDIDEYSELPLCDAIKLLEQIDDNFSLAVRDFIGDLMLEQREQDSEHTPKTTIRLQSVQSFFNDTQFQLGYELEQLERDIIDFDRDPYDEISIEDLTFFMSRIKHDFNAAINDYMNTMRTKALVEKSDEQQEDEWLSESAKYWKQHADSARHMMSLVASLENLFSYRFSLTSGGDYSDLSLALEKCVFDELGDIDIRGMQEYIDSVKPKLRLTGDCQHNKKEEPTPQAYVYQWRLSDYIEVTESMIAASRLFLKLEDPMLFGRKDIMDRVNEYLEVIENFKCLPAFEHTDEFARRARIKLNKMGYEKGEN